MGRPMSRRLLDGLAAVVDKEKKKQAIVFEFAPNVSQSHASLVTLLDNINLQVIQLEKLLGRENRLTQPSYEAQGFNLKTALIQMHAWMQQHAPEHKTSDRHFDEMNARLKSINDGIKKRLENQTMSLPLLRDVKELFDLYKGLLKYEGLVDRSLTLARSWDRLTLMQEERPFEFEAMDAKAARLGQCSAQLQTRVATVAQSMASSLGEVNAKLTDLENKMKAKL